MRTVMAAVVAIVMVFGSAASVAMAQDAATPAASPEAGGGGAAAGGETSFAKGTDAEATYFSERGDPIATLKVVDVERGWKEYDQYSKPDPGVEYVAVTFEVASVGGDNVVVKQFDFSLIDSIGRNNSAAFVQVADDSKVKLLDDDAAVADGESTRFVLVFQVFKETGLGYFLWQPDSGIIIVVDLTDS